MSLATLSWLPDFDKPLSEVFEKLSPEWVALTSLFYEGDITMWVEVEEHSRNKKSRWNVYSIPALQRYCNTLGYRVTRVDPFHLNLDLPEPENKGVMGTYTKRVWSDGGNVERLQISGPMLQSWYQLLIERSV
jgi:hypothetical protein